MNEERIEEQIYFGNAINPEEIKAAENVEALKKAERQLTAAMSEDTAQWYAVYMPMATVIDGEYYAPTYRSPSAWIADFANRIHRSESLLWRYYKVGKFYDEYIGFESKEGRRAIQAKDSALSARSLVLIEQVSDNDFAKASRLIRQTRDGKISTQDLEQMKKDLQRKRLASGQNAHPKNGRDRDKLKLKVSDGQTSLSATAGVSADRIKAVLQIKPQKDQSGYDPSHWLIQFRDQCFDASHDLSQNEILYGTPKYKAMQEFPVYTGTTQSGKPRQIDTMVLESFTSQRASVTLHGIEIKVSQYDLERDKKMGDYTDFCDFFWVCVPVELVEIAESVISPVWGILSVGMIEDDDVSPISVKMVRAASRNNATSMEEACRTAVRRLI